MNVPGVGVSVIVFRDERAEEILLVQRGKEPRLGMWAPPGGRIEWGETVAEAAAREVLEETGLVVTIPDEAVFTTVDVLQQNDQGRVTFHFVLVEILALCDDPAAPIAAGDDAADCRWWPLASLHEAQPQVEQLAKVVELAKQRAALITSRKV